MNSATEFADRIRNMIRHESILVNHRMTWFLTCQSILFAALSFAWGKDWLPVVLSTIGLVVCLSFHVSMCASIRAVQGLEQCWFEKCKELEIEPSSEPPVNGLYKTQIKSIEKILFPWRLLPWFLGLTWILIGGKFVFCKI
jgi:hypothetical protein